MNDLRPLPAREPPLPGESLASLVRRHSQAMGYERLRQLTGLLQFEPPLSPHLNAIGSDAALQSLGCLLDRSPEELLGLTVHGYAPRLVLKDAGAEPADRCDSKTVLKYFRLSAAPICPQPAST